MSKIVIIFTNRCPDTTQTQPLKSVNHVTNKGNCIILNQIKPTSFALLFIKFQNIKKCITITVTGA